MADISERVQELAELMTEFGLEEARLSGEDWSVELGVNPKNGRTVLAAPAVAANDAEKPAPRAKKSPSSGAASAAPAGIPVTSPMSGIFYSSSSPGAPAFAKEGDMVEAGQVVALIEAMKVFSEIHAPVAGRVTKVACESGKLVQPGDPLLYIG